MDQQRSCPRNLQSCGGRQQFSSGAVQAEVSRKTLPLGSANARFLLLDIIVPGCLTSLVEWALILKKHRVGLSPTPILYNRIHRWPRMCSIFWPRLLLDILSFPFLGSQGDCRDSRSRQVHRMLSFLCLHFPGLSFLLGGQLEASLWGSWPLVMMAGLMGRSYSTTDPGMGPFCKTI